MQNINKELIKNPVIEIQMYLREVAKCKPQIPIIYPNGIYDEKTRNAVTIFQEIHGISTTGKVDIITWNALVNENRLCAIKNNAIVPNKVSIFPSNNHECRLDDECDSVYVIQILLRNFSKKFKCEKIDITGIYDVATVEAVKGFQKLNKLDQTGIVDLQTWNALTHINNVCGFYSM